jgi:hypothetical protein
MTLGLLQIQIIGSQVKSELAFIFTLYGAIIAKYKSEVERNLINTSLRNFKRLQSKHEFNANGRTPCSPTGS